VTELPENELLESDSLSIVWREVARVGIAWRWDRNTRTVV